MLKRASINSTSSKGTRLISAHLGGIWLLVSSR